MSSLEILQTLEKEFKDLQAPYQERKIVFWNDYEKKFIDIIDQIKIQGVRVHKLEETNNFYTKYLLEEEDTKSNFLIYNTINIEDERDQWLLDIMLYSQKFYADHTSLIMKELNLDNKLREVYEKYKAFFNATERRKKFIRYNKEILDEQTMELTILASLSNSKTIDFEEILKIVLMESLIEEENKYFILFDKYDMTEAFWKYANIKYGYDHEKSTLKKLYIYILTTALATYIPEEKLSRISNFIGKNKPNCVIFVDHWMNHLGDAKKYEELADIYEKEMHIAEIIEELPIEDYIEIDLAKVFDRAVINYIVESLENNIEDYERYVGFIKVRRSKHFYSYYRYLYEAVLNAIEICRFNKEHYNNLVTKTPDKLFKEYTETNYQMDTYYRKFYVAYDNKPDSQVINRLVKLVENIYTNWYMLHVGTSWTSSIADNMIEDWKIPGVMNQQEFYENHVSKMINKGDRVFVIISDAMRYEIGVELKNRLNEDVIGSTNIQAMLSKVPSITKIGMGALLPHKQLQITIDGKVLADEVDISSTKNRNKILNNTVKDSIAIDYKKIPKGKLEFMEALKGYKLVYIYHDTIDAIADKGGTEGRTFEVVEKGIEEIMDLVRRIKDYLGGINILITSDHGFTYQRSELSEADKIDKVDMESIDKGRRYIISTNNTEYDSLLKVDMKNIVEGSNLYAYMPKSHMRFKTQGEGAQFVHGGATLQEVVIPVVTFKNIRSSYKNSIKAQKVSIKLTNEVRKITNSIFTLNFFQTERISNKTIPATIEVYMVDERNDIISSIETIIADLDSDKPELRVIKTKLTLKPMNYNRTCKYYLILKDKETEIEIEKIPFNISLGIASDFDF